MKATWPAREVAHHCIQRKISTRELRAGEPLPEIAISKEREISRTLARGGDHASPMRSIPGLDSRECFHSLPRSQGLPFWIAIVATITAAGESLQFRPGFETEAAVSSLQMSMVSG